MRSSLFSQLLRSKVFIILACFVPLVGFGIFQINRIYFEQSQMELKSVSWLLKGPVRNYLMTDDIVGLEQWLKSIERDDIKQRIRITLIDPSGAF